jgi:hypothetical protein
VRIEVTRSGGFAGITRAWTLEVSSAEAEQRWLPLAEAEAGGERQDSAPSPGSGGHRDRFTYRISVGYVEVQLPESRLQDPWRELVERARAASERATEPPDTGQGTSGQGGPRKPPELL